MGSVVTMALTALLLPSSDYIDYNFINGLESLCTPLVLAMQVL